MPNLEKPPLLVLFTPSIPSPPPDDLTTTLYLALPRYSDKQIIELSTILYLEGNGNYATFHLGNGERLLVARTLVRYGGLPGFWRIHKRYLVNGQYIARLEVKDTPRAWVHLHNGVRLPIARRRLKAVKRAFYQPGLRAVSPNPTC